MLTIQGIEPIIALKQALVRENLVGHFQLGTLQPDFYEIIEMFIDASENKDIPMGYYQDLKTVRKAKIARLSLSKIPANQIEGKLTSQELLLFKTFRGTSDDFDSSSSRQ